METDKTNHISTSGFCQTIGIPDVTSTMTTTAKPWNFCPQCAHELETGWNFCAGCGERLSMAAWIYPQPVVAQYLSWISWRANITYTVNTEGATPTAHFNHSTLPNSSHVADSKADDHHQILHLR